MSLSKKISMQHQALKNSSAMRHIQDRELAIQNKVRVDTQNLSVITMKERRNFIAQQQQLAAIRNRNQETTNTRMMQNRIAQQHVAKQHYMLREQKGLTGFGGFVRSLPLNLVKASVGAAVIAGLFVGANNLLKGNSALTQERLHWNAIEMSYGINPSGIKDYLRELQSNLSVEKQRALMDYIHTTPSVVRQLSKSPELLSVLATTFPHYFQDKSELKNFDYSILSSAEHINGLGDDIVLQGKKLARLDAALEGLGMSVPMRDKIITSALENGTNMDVERLAKAASTLLATGSPLSASMLGNELKYLMGDEAFKQLLASSKAVKELVPEQALAPNRVSAPKP